MPGQASNEAVSSVVGTMLMLGITVVVFTAVSITVLNTFSHKSQAPETDIVTLKQGAQYLLVHRGGQPIPTSGSTLRANVNGVEFTLPLSTFSSQLGTSWTPGESICLAGPIPPCQYAAGSVLGSQVIASNTLIAAEGTVGVTCTDSMPPTVQTWTQNPANVQSTTAGPVLVTSVLTDNCWGVDTSVNPTLYWRVSPRDSSYASAAMIRSTGTTWTGTIPTQTWSTLTGQTLQYYIAGQRDIGGNTQSNTPNALRQDVVDNGCATDITPPTVLSWTQTPPDVSTSALGAVAVTATLTDNCYGVDTTVNPTLYWQVSPRDAVYTSAGAMTKGAGAIWSGNIPSQTWTGLGNNNLNYYIAGQKDLNGNTQANTPNGVQSDLIQGGLLDPGQAYIDPNNNGFYDVGETKIATSTIQTGTYSTTGTNGLVIPASVGALSAGTINFQAGGQLTVAVSMTATSGTLTLVSKSSQPLTVLGSPTFTTQGSNLNIILTSAAQLQASGGLTATASGQILISTLGDSDLTGARLTSGGLAQKVSVDTTLSGFLTFTNGVATATGPLILRGVGVTADNALLTTQGSAQDLTLDAGSGVLTLNGPAPGCTTYCLTASGQIILTGSGIDLDNNKLTTGGANPITGTASATTLSLAGTTAVAGGAISFTASGALLDATAAKLTSTTSTALTGVGVTLTNAKITTLGTDQPITVAAGTGALTATGPGPTCATPYCIGASGPVTFSGASATLDGNTLQAGGASNLLKVTTTTGAISAVASTFTASAGVTLTGGTGLTLTNAQVSGAAGALALTATSGSLTATGATWSTAGTITASAPATTRLSGSVTATGGTGAISLTGSSVLDGRGATLTAGTSITLTGGATTFDGTLAATGAFTATGSSLTFDAAVISTAGSTQDLRIGTTTTCGTSTSGTISAKNAKLTSSGQTCVRNASGTLTLDGACITTGGTTQAITVTSAGLVSATGPSTPAGCTGLAATGPISITGVGVTLSNAKISSGGSLQDINIAAGSGALTAKGPGTQCATPYCVTATGQLVMTGGSISLDGNTFTSGTGQKVSAIAASTTVSAVGSKLQSGGDVTLTAGTTMTLTNAILNAGGTGNVALTAPTTIAGTGATSTSGGSITIAGGAATFTSTLTATGTFTATGTSLTFDGATITTGGSAQDLRIGSTTTCGTSTTAAISAKNAKLTATGAICVRNASSTITLDGACATTGGTTKAITLTAGAGALSATGPSTPAGCNGFSATGPITITATAITVGSGRFVTAGSNQAITVTSSAGAISAPSSSFSSSGGTTFAATGGGIDFTSATLSAPGRSLISTVPASGGFKVNVASASFTDSNNKLKVNPNNTATYVTGTPSFGGTE